MTLNLVPESRRQALGVALVAALTVIGWFDLHQHYGVAPGLAMLLGLARALPFLWSWRRPLLAVLTVLAASVVTAMVSKPFSHSEPWPWSVSSTMCLLPVVGVASARLSRRTILAVAAGFVATTALLLAVFPDNALWSELVFAAVGAGLVVVAAEGFRGRSEATRLLAEQEEISEAERTRRALLEERSRIGRELHDVVAHHMSLIAVQAETAPYRLPEQSEETKAEFRAISAAAREALTDMRKLLGLLRGDAAAETAPQPSMAEIPALVRSAPGADFSSAGRLDDVPTIVGVSAYRIVQESLSNARRHAAGASVAVTLERTEDAVRVEVRNARSKAPASGAAPEQGSPDGLGLTGMRERVALLDGEFSFGPTAEGGFAVVAVLPLRS